MKLAQFLLILESKLNIMKYLSVLLFILSNAAFAQEIDEIPFENDQVIYKEVVQLPGIDTTELNARAQHFFKHAANVSKFVKKGNSISAPAFSDFYAGKKKLKIKMTYDLFIETKDGRYRIVVKNIAFTPYPDPYTPQPTTTTAELMRSNYLENKGKKKNQARYQYEFFRNSKIAFANRVEEIKEVMRKSVPQEKEEW